MMYAKIKELADGAIAWQNKDRMDAVLREISGMCGGIKVVSGIAEYSGEPRRFTLKDLDGSAEMMAGEQLSEGDAVVNVGGKAKKAAKK